MDENISNGLYIGVTVMIFIAAISTALILMSTITRLSDLSLETLDKADKNIIETPELPNAYVITGAEILSYYSNYVMPQNTEFEFYVDTRTTMGVSDAEIGYDGIPENHHIARKVDLNALMSTCVKLTNEDDQQVRSTVDKLKTGLESLYVKVVKIEDNITKIYFIKGDEDKNRTIQLLECIRQFG